MRRSSRMTGLRREKADAVAAMMVVVGATLLPVAGAFPSTVDGFFDGTTDALVAFAAPPARTLVGTLLIPSTATAVSATATIGPSNQTDSWAVVESATTGLAMGQPAGGASLTASGLTLALKSGASEFSGVALDAGA